MAAALGCTVGELRQRMGAAEFAAWQVMFAKDMLHPYAQQVRHAQVLAAIYTGQAKPPRGKRSFSAADFVGSDPWAAPPAAAPTRQPTAAEIAAQVKEMNSMRRRK